MDFSELINEVKSGIVHLLFINSNEEKIASGSGFLIINKVVTCDHLLSQLYPPGTRVLLRFEDSPPDNFESDISLSMEKLKESVEAASPEQENDYCVLNIPEINYNRRYTFDIEGLSGARVGTEILFMGYPFDHSNLVSHRGYISSIYTRDKIGIIQLDASVNASNSGGPLIDPYTKKVLGIITRKQTGLSKDFDVLITALDKTIKNFSEKEGPTVLVGGLVIKDAFLVIQRQLKIVAQNMKRSSNSGIGFAFDLTALKTVYNPDFSK